MEKPVDVTIRIDSAKAEQLDHIVDELKRAGLSRVQAHGRFMMISGCVRADHMDALRKVEGVESVRQDQTYRPL